MTKAWHLNLWGAICPNFLGGKGSTTNSRSVFTIPFQQVQFLIFSVILALALEICNHAPKNKAKTIWQARIAPTTPKPAISNVILWSRTKVDRKQAFLHFFLKFHTAFIFLGQDAKMIKKNNILGKDQRKFPNITKVLAHFRKKNKKHLTFEFWLNLILFCYF